MVGAAAAGFAAAFLNAFVGLGYFGFGWAWCGESDTNPNACDPASTTGPLSFYGTAIVLALTVLAFGSLRSPRARIGIVVALLLLLAPNISMVAHYGINVFHS